MRKTLLWLYFLLLPLFASANVIYSTPTAIDWSGTAAYASIDKAQFTDVAVSDRMVFNITYTGQVDYPQIALVNGNWNGLACAGNQMIGEQTTQVTYYLTAMMLAELQTSGLIVSGHGYTLNSVELETGTRTSGLDHAVWIGSDEYQSDWSVYSTLPSSCFKNAVTSNLLRFHYKQVKVGAQLSLRGSDWKTLSGTDAVTPEGAYVQFVVTDAMLKSIQSGGLIVTGSGFTLSYVEVLDAASLLPLTTSVPIVDNWVFEDGAQPTVTINVANHNLSDVTARAELRVTTDSYETYKTLSETIDVKAGESTMATFVFDAEPGFYHCTALVNEELARAFTMGVDPEKIVSVPDRQTDFDVFWQKAKSELAAVDMNAKLTKIDSKSTATRNVYLVELNSIPDTSGGESVVIRGYYAEPIAPGCYPAIIHYQGYDSGSYDPWCPNGDDLKEYCEFALSTRGQLINNRNPYTNTYGDWFQYNFGDKDTYYYRSAYMDVLRAIDFVCSREKADTDKLFAEGASQGGAFTYAAAALSDHPFVAIAPAIPFMGNFPEYFKVGSWPAYQARLQQTKLGMSDAEMYAFLSYFDTKNLAATVTSPVISTIGLQDNVCPPRTNIAPYNNLPATTTKQISYNPEMMHQTPTDWYATYMSFFENCLLATGINSTPAISAPNTTSAVSAIVSSDMNYNLGGQKADSSYHGMVIQKGKKIYRK